MTQASSCSFCHVLLKTQVTEPRSAFEGAGPAVRGCGGLGPTAGRDKAKVGPGGWQWGGYVADKESVLLEA